MDKNVFLVDKPKGITSFDVIRILRKKLGIRKMGHAGTLDPLASGLMIIGMDEGTKKMSEFLKLPKVYIADILLGKKTDTGDMEGRVIKEEKVGHIAKEKIREIVASFVGKHSLPVPMYSAVKISGTPLYKRARRNEKNIVTPVKEMEVISAQLLSVKGAVLQIEMEVSSGTYIRSLSENLGERLGYPAMLSGLRRTRIGEFLINDAIKIVK